MNKEKAKEISSNLWAKTKTNFARTRQRTLELLGKAEKIVDVNYNQERDRFLEHYKNVQKLNKDAARVLELLKELSVAQATLAEDFYAMYDSSATLYNAALKNQDIAKIIDNARVQTETVIKADALDPISKYLGQFKEIKERISTQDTRRVDVERYARDVKIYSEKNNREKLATTEPKLESAKANYANLTDELMADMPALYDDRIPFFDPVFATYLSQMADFYRQAAKSSNEALSLVAHVKREAIHDHPRVITPTEESSASHKVTAVVNSTTSSPLNSTPVSRVSSTNSVVEEAEPFQSQPSAPPQTNPTSTGRGLPTPARTMPTPPSKPGLKKAKAIYDFPAQDASELPFKVNDVLTIHTMNGEWWEAELNGKKGLIPSNYVQLA